MPEPFHLQSLSSSLDHFASFAFFCASAVSLLSCHLESSSASSASLYALPLFFLQTQIRVPPLSTPGSALAPPPLAAASTISCSTGVVSGSAPLFSFISTASLAFSWASAVSFPCYLPCLNIHPRFHKHAPTTFPSQHSILSQLSKCG